MSKITDKQKLDYLFKKTQNLGFTDLDSNNKLQPLFENRNYILGRDILLDQIPDVSQLTQNVEPTDVNLTSSNFYNSSPSLKRDSESILLKVEKLKLIKIPNTTNSWYCPDKNGENFITPAINTNYGIKNGTVLPNYQLQIYSEQGLNRFSRGESYLANELLRTCDYIFDYNTGILLLTDKCKDNEGDLINNNNPPYITFFKYIGTSSGGSGSGLSGQWTKNENNDIYFEDGSVLIGTDEKSPSLTQIDLEVSGNVYISGNLEVSGNVIKRDELHVYGDISANYAEFDELDICGNLTTKNLIVNGNTVLKDISGADASFNNVDINYDLNVEGKSIFQNVSGADASFNNVDINDDLNVEGKSIFQNVSGADASFNNVDINDDLNVEGKSIFQNVSGADASFNNVDINDDLNVEGKSIFQNVSGADASFNNVDINDDLNVEGKSIFQNVSGADASFNNVDINDDLNVEGKSIFKDVSGADASFNNVDINDDLNVEGKSIFQNVSGADASFNNVDINDDLNVEGKSIFQDVSGADASFNNVDINDNLNVNGKSIFQDVSLNKIGTATTDVSNIVIDGNLTPSINEGYDLGSSSKAWRELYLSNNSIIFKQEGEDNKNDVISIGIDTTTDDDGSTNYTLELNVKGKDDSDNEPAKKIKLARGKVRQTTHNGVKTRKAETFLEDLSFNNVDICGNKLSAKNIYITGNIYKDGEEFSSGAVIEISGNETNVEIDNNESKIFYDASRNLFIGGVRQYADEPSRDTNPVLIEPLGYSFFRENMEGQPPAPSFFFFSITPSSIQINWTNPKQYVSGVSNTNDSYNNATNGEFSATVNSNGNIYFPVVNRIMIQIKDRADNSYKYWGTKTSPISSGVSGLDHGRVICSKNYPIPPIKTGISPVFTGTTSISNGRDNKIYELNDFANSIILYSTGSTPENNNLSITGDNEKRISGNKSDSNSTELASSIQGYEIKLWLENQYNSGSMTESDFNVVTLNDTGDGVTPINFSAADPPSTDASLNAIIKFNHLPTATNGVQNGKTYVELQIKDPSRAANDKPDLNSSINLTGIEFEIAYYDDNETPQFNLVSKIYFKDKTSISTNSDLPSSYLSDGLHEINRLRDNDTRYYYVPLDNTKSKKNIQFRIRYKNATNPDFELQTETSIIVVNKPNKPIISQIKMSRSDRIEISIAAMTANNKISNTSSANNNNGVFLRTIDLIAKYQSDNGNNIGEYRSQITTQGVDDRNYYHKNTQDKTTTYIFSLPSGEHVPTLSSLKWAFQVRVKNNLINEWSEISDTAISNNNIDKTKNNAIEITEVSTNNSLSNIKFENQSDRNGGIIQLNWNDPVAGDRGVITGKLENTTDQNPKIKDYEVSIFRPDVSINRIVKTFTNTQANRTSDATNSKPYDDIFSIIEQNGSSENASGAGLGTTNTEKEIKVLVKQRNEYVTNQTDVSRSIFYKLGAPNPPNTNTNTSAINKTGNNTITLKWSKNTTTGFQTRELVNSILAPSLSNKEVGVINYRVNISANAPQSKSPYYRLAGGKFTSAPTASQTIIDINISDSSEAKTYLTQDSDDGIIDKSDTWSGSSGTVGDVLVFPDTSYTFNIWSKNIFNIESKISQMITINTGLPPSINSQMTSSTIPINATYNDVNGLISYTYPNKGFLLDNTIDTKPSQITLYQITKALGGSDYRTKFPEFSASVTHRINRNKFNDFLVDNDNDKNPSEYVKLISQLDSKKLRQFRILNNTNLIYTFGSDIRFSSITNNTTNTALENMLTITSSDIKDEYNESSRDPNNKGYWWKETMNYTITIDDTKSTLYKKPIKLTFKVRYNKQLSSNTSWSNSSLNNNEHVDVVEKVIFQNTENSSNVIYFDKLTSLPSAIKNGSTDMINYTTDNKINGIPNLYIISNDYNYQLSLNYNLTNFSEYYGLDPDINFVEHTLKSNSGSNVSISEIEPRSWDSKSDCMRTESKWNITNLSITNSSTTNVSNVNLGSSSETGSVADVRLQLNLKNTFGNNNFDVSGNHSNVFRFIYDKNSVDEFTSIETSLQNIPSDFDPTYGSTSAQSSTTPTAYNAVGNTTNNLQMSMYDGYFYSNAGWQNITGITTSNCSNYGMSNTLPVFRGQDSDFKYVIFKYKFTPSSTFSPYKVILVLGDTNNFSISDLNTNLKVFIFTGDSITGADSNSYYWFNISKFSDITDAAASAGAVVYSGGIADSSYETMSNPNFINSSDINGSGKFTNNFSGSIPKRIIGARINKISISANTEKTIYVAIGLKNSVNLYLKKPSLYLAKGVNDYDTKQFI